MSAFRVQIKGEIIVLSKASDKTQLKLAFNRFIDTLGRIIVLNQDIEKSTM